MTVGIRQHCENRKLSKLISKMTELYQELSEKKNIGGLDGWDDMDYALLTVMMIAKDEHLEQLENEILGKQRGRKKKIGGRTYD